MKNHSKSDFLLNCLWLIFGFLGIVGFILVWFAFPHQSQIESVWQMLFKLLAFLLIVLSISFFPNKSKSNYLLLLIPLFFYTGYLIPRLSYYGFTGRAASDAISSGEYYTLLYLLLFPSIILVTALAFRLGGGTPGNVIKIALSGVIILFSGFLDILWYIINPVEIPKIIKYAHHIKMILGHYPKFSETIIFAICHIPLLIIVLLIPFDKLINQFIYKQDQPSLNM